MARCTSLRSTLIVPFTWTGSRPFLDAWIEAMCGRRIPARRKGKEPVPLWMPSATVKLPDEVSELNETFKRSLPQPADTATGTPWRFRWVSLVLDPDARNRLLREPRLWVKGQPLVQPVLERLEVMVHPLGASMLLMHLDWLPDQKPVEMAQAQRILSVARHVQPEENHPGWTLGPLPRGAETGARDEPPQDYREALGDAMWGACHDGRPASLADIITWLLRPEDQEALPAVTLPSRYAMHHTTVILDHDPGESELHDAAFHFRRACDGTYQAPPLATEGRDAVLRVRTNRVLAVAREGAASLSWPVEGANQQFESQWYSKFQGIYLLLHLQALNESSTLAILSTEAAKNGMLLGKAEIGAKPLSKTASTRRDDLQGLVLHMAEYTLTMPPEDCGGPTEYVEFFSACRRVRGIPGQLAELRQELAEVTSLVETLYLEHREREREAQRTRDHSAEKRVSWFVAFITILALPPAVLGGLYGMNEQSALPDAYPPITFRWVLGLWGAWAALVIVAQLLERWHARRGRASLRPPPG